MNATGGSSGRQSRVGRSSVWILVIALAALSGMACRRAASEDAPRRAERAVPRPVQGAPAASRPVPMLPAPEQAFRYPAPHRLVAFGDVHGDIVAARRVLELVGAADASGNWVGGDIVVVQTGDQLDRGDDERDILDWWVRLAEQAKASGGAFHVLNGNHEAMNVAGQFSYVTARGFSAFEEFANDRERAPLVARLPAHARGRAAAFLPGGRYARVLAERPSVIVVGKSVFVHGGLREEHVRYGVTRINHELRQWMLGKAPVPEALTSERSPLWIRDFGLDPLAPDACRDLENMLSALGVTRLVIGHTIQERGINAACDGKVWRLDVAMASFYGEHPVQALEVRGDEVRVLGGTSGTPPVKGKAQVGARQGGARAGELGASPP